MDKKASTQWNKSSISYDNYGAYIKNKNNPLDLKFIDLLYIKNFKGGNSTINEFEDVINAKLDSYSKKLLAININFPNPSLSVLTNDQIKILIDLIMDICNLANDKASTKIDGFGVSNLSALLSAHFPQLIPILDRRLLINLKLVKKRNLDKQNQVKKIRAFYPALIKKVAILSNRTNKELREIDRKYFIKELNIAALHP